MNRMKLKLEDRNIKIKILSDCWRGKIGFAMPRFMQAYQTFVNTQIIRKDFSDHGTPGTCFVQVAVIRFRHIDNVYFARSRK